METLLELDDIRLEKEQRVAWVTLTRERFLNAMSNAAVDQLTRVALALREDPDVRVVVLRGAGRAFCTGIDLKELSAGTIDMSYFHRWEYPLRIFETMEKLVICALHGYALGGGLQLALASDIRISTADCQLGLPAINESLIPGLGPWRLPKYIGWGRARRMIFGGQSIAGDEALRIGLVDHVVPGDSFFAHVDEFAYQYLRSCSLGTRMSKQLMHEAFELDYEQAFQRYIALQERTHFSLDAEEAKRAYREQRDPLWH